MAKREQRLKDVGPEFRESLLEKYRPRLAAIIQTNSGRVFGMINFESEDLRVMERVTLASLAEIGWMSVPTDLGVDLIKKDEKGEYRVVALGSDVQTGQKGWSQEFNIIYIMRSNVGTARRTPRAQSDAPKASPQRY